MRLATGKYSCLSDETVCILFHDKPDFFKGKTDKRSSIHVIYKNVEKPV